MSKSRARRSPAEERTPINRPAAPFWARFPEGAALDLIVALGLILSVVAVYGQVGHFDFINYDDGDYTYKNPHVQQGLTADSVRWAMTAVVADNWMPVTLLSHLLDVQLFGMDSGAMHWVNVWLHALAAALLFWVLRRATRQPAASAFVAFVFALHPLHVGSVAWIAERKDVLSALFWFLALYCYLRYVEKPGSGRYLLMLVPVSLGLMSKPMMVTFPFTLLLFDIWPLGRFSWPKAVWEKIPLFALSAAASAMTYWVQRSSGAVSSLQSYPIPTRIGNALVSYILYLGQTVWPVRLAVFYPYPKSIPIWEWLLAAALVLAVSAAVLRARRTRPYLMTGWFWYVGTLVPVIGFVQVGAQAHADRYTYIPMIGLTIMAAWSAMDLIREHPGWKTAVALTAAGVTIACAAAAWSETGYWKNNETVFHHAIESTGTNWLAEMNMGEYLMNLGGRASEAIPHFQLALRLFPGLAEINNDLGACMLIDRRYAEAIPYLEAAVHANPKLANAQYDLGMALAHTPGREADAIAHYEAALRLNPENDLAHNNLGLLLLKAGRTGEALTHFEAAVRIHPDYGCERNLGETLAKIPGRETEAIAHLEAAQRFNPDPEITQTINRLRAGR